MFKFIFLMFLVMGVNVDAVEFVLFTQPKTATHLLIPILTDLTKKSVYWAPEYTKHAEPLQGSFADAAQDPANFLFTLNKAPWSRQVMDCIWEINKTNGTYLHLHAPYSQAMEKYLAEKKCINFFIKRDPRDQIISLLNHYKYIHLNDNEVGLLATDDEKLLHMIKKASKEQTLNYMKWLHSPVCCVLNFEKLMGVHGGAATCVDAMGEMRTICNALQLNLSEGEMKKVYDRHWGSGWSFFKGKVGVWRDYFNEEHIAAIKEEIGDLLIQLGYEEDFAW